ncbi:hypothetical protein [Tunturiibacter gelidiferens]|uniref:hypothetical protein n=1 Tax=Tunturiibacter gelidiferens TaxID=3069689 RepID=UPI003D9B27EB
MMKLGRFDRVVSQTVLVSFIVPCLFTAGCSIGPKYRRRTIQTAPAYKELDTSSWRTAEPKDNIAVGSGLDPFLKVLTAQVDLLVYQQTHVAFQTQQMVASVQLIKAIGGGWDASQLPSSKQTARGSSKVQPNGK